MMAMKFSNDKVVSNFLQTFRSLQLKQIFIIFRFICRYKIALLLRWDCKGLGNTSYQSVEFPTRGLRSIVILSQQMYGRILILT